MRNIYKYRVLPKLPKRLEPLQEMAYNLWWCWNPDAIVLFRRFHPVLWESTYYNPVEILGRTSQAHIDKILKDDAFIAEMDRIYKQYQNYLSRKTWSDREIDHDQEMCIAYFSAEFGLTESIRTYSGGLGILSGDHLKAASDLGIPLVGVGLLYRQGYFNQYLNVDGWQQELYLDSDFYNMPIKQVLNEKNQILKFPLAIGNRNVMVQIWKIIVGRIPLYLLDTNLDENRPEDREITAQLYGGDVEMRIRQEILLGIGGIRALRLLGIKPTITHMNEGHSAFLAIERIRNIMEEQNVNFAVARELVISTNVFTTHTPVPAGMDIFAPDLVDRYLFQHRSVLGLSREEFLGFGRQDPFNHAEYFSMPVLALKMAAYCNGVSELHGQVSRQLWEQIWPEVPHNEIPIGSITNGVHPRTWISRDMVGLLDRYLTPEWEANPADPNIWQRVVDIPDAELWRTHERRRERLVAFARTRLRKQLINRGAHKSEISIAEEVLDPEILTIGFARRFATYKRAGLLFKDPDRLLKILTNKERPVQLLMAGKAHPRDNEGKELIKYIISFARKPEFRKHVVFLENYDMNIARYMVQGVDVWLNNPRRPLEASGTSGMKVAFNGGLNLSILDGWWDEAFQEWGNLGIGWAIGRGEDYADTAYQDAVESRALYKILEEEMIPLFYNRGYDDLPRGWIQYMKNSMQYLCPRFNIHRMLTEYTRNYYIRANQKWHELSLNNFDGAKRLSEWRTHIHHAWTNLKIMKIEMDDSKEYFVGQKLKVNVLIQLGELNPEDITAEIYFGTIGSRGELNGGQFEPLVAEEKQSNGTCRYYGAIPCDNSGLQGFAVRVLPNNPRLARRMIPGLILWG